MKFASQRVAYPYFMIAILLFSLQLIFGLYLAFSYFMTVPQPVVQAFSFATARAFHLNLLVLWMLLAFMGGTYFMVPEECAREIHSVKLAYIQLVVLVGTGVVALIGFLFGWTQGRPILEIPRPLDFLIVLGALIFLYNVGMTIILARKWTVIQGSLFGGLVFLALLYFSGMPFYRNEAIDWYYWWWNIHLWVEGAWELVAGALIAWILLKITGVERQVVEKWLYIELGLFLFTGIAGTGHHYYWLGAPHYWLWIGGVFSALEPLPIALMLVDTWRHVKERKLEITNHLTWLCAIGCAIYHVIGAGVWGFVHTLPQINRWTHGSQVTVSHGHMAFFGAYALLNLTIFYYAIPKLKGIDRYDGRLGTWAFWIMSLAMMGIGLSFGIAGVLQAYIERMMGNPYMVAQQYMRFWFACVFAFGLIFLAGQLLFVKHILTLKPAPAPQP